MHAMQEREWELKRVTLKPKPLQMKRQEEHCKWQLRKLL